MNSAISPSQLILKGKRKSEAILDLRK